MAMTPEERKEKRKAQQKAWRAANTEKRKAQQKAWYAANTEKHKAQQKAWYAANPEKQEKRKAQQKAWYAANPEKGINSSIKCRYGITLEDVKRISAQQGNRCKLCSISFDEKKPNIDHCHTTGRVRGILCPQCNIRLGYLETRGRVELLKDLDYLGWP